MEKKIKQQSTLFEVDDSANQLFGELEKSKGKKELTLSYIPSFFTTASLPFKNMRKKEFVRKASNGISLILNSPSNVP